VPVDLHGDPLVGVPDPVADDLGVDAAVQRERGVGVADVVKGPGWSARSRPRRGGANPERTTCECPSRPETQEQEHAGQLARHDTPGVTSRDLASAFTPKRSLSGVVQASDSHDAVESSRSSAQLRAEVYLDTLTDPHMCG
jgi:hypothetical protein